MVFPWRAVVGCAFDEVTLPPVTTETTMMSAMAIAAPMPSETNIMGEGCPRVGLVVSDKDINRHHDEQGR